MPRSVNSSSPRQDEPRSPCQPPSRSDDRRPFAKPSARTILLVEDDSAVRESLMRLFSIEGWRMVSAATGEEALERLVALKPDLLITDLCMAEVSGWDLLFHENLQRPTLPIFVITALPPPDAGGADRFATEYFQKPLDLDALVTAIHHCLGTAPSHADANEPPRLRPLAGAAITRDDRKSEISRTLPSRRRSTLGERAGFTLGHDHEKQNSEFLD